MSKLRRLSGIQGGPGWGRLRRLRGRGVIGRSWIGGGGDGRGLGGDAGAGELELEGPVMKSAGEEGEDLAGLDEEDAAAAR